MSYKIEQHYDDFFGVDTRSNGVKREQNNPQDALNMDYSESDKTIRRIGYANYNSQTGTDLVPTDGIYKYIRRNTDDGSREDFTLGINRTGDILQATSQIINVSVNTDVDASKYFDKTDGHYKFVVNSTVIDLGTGEEAVPMTMSTLAGLLVGTVEITSIDTPSNGNSIAATVEDFSVTAANPSFTFTYSYFTKTHTPGS